MKHGLTHLPRQGGVIGVGPGSIDTPLAQNLTVGDLAIMAEFMRDEPIGWRGQPDEITSAVQWRCDPGPSNLVGPALFDGDGETVH